MNRRGFLNLIAASVAIASLPKADIAYANGCGDKVSLFECQPLKAGTHTVNAMCKQGLLVVGVDAKGGETRIALPENHYYDVFIGPVIFKFGEGGTRGKSIHNDHSHRISVGNDYIKFSSGESLFHSKIGSDK